MKTIGDAVMAVFPRPEAAVQAALEMQQKIGAFNRAHHIEPPLVIKLGVHQGPMIAINANNRLDYFGRTVNIAARVQGEASVVTWCSPLTSCTTWRSNRCSKTSPPPDHSPPC